MADVVDVADVSRRYGDTVALDGVSLSVEAGEVFGLIGPNGAGKTTLVRALLGTTAVDGDVTVFGGHPADVDRDRIGFLPQDFEPPRRLTPRELLAYFGGLYDEAGEPGPLLADVGLAADADRPYEALSGGQQRRTCVATALVNDPDLLVLDEPTTGIDPAGRRALWRLVEDLAAGGTTVLLTTHYMAEAQTLADRVALLADGRLVALDTPDALVATHGGESLLLIEGAFDEDVKAAVGEVLGAVREEGDPVGEDPEAIGDVPETDVDAPGTDVEAPGTDVEVRDGELRARNVPPREIGAVVDAIEAAGGQYDSVTWTEPDLEDVYLALAGAEEGE